MKQRIRNILLGIMIGSVMTAWAGSYTVTVVTSASTDTLFPIMVNQYNARNGTNLTALQYAQQVCSKDIEGKTQQWLSQLGQ